MPIIGADFLSHYNLLVSVRDKTLRQPTVAASCLSSDYAPLLKKYSDVFSDTLIDRPSSARKHGISHFIKTKGPPVYSKFRRLSPENYIIAKKVFLDLEKQGICQKASSPYASPLHMVITGA